MNDINKLSKRIEVIEREKGDKRLRVDTGVPVGGYERERRIVRQFKKFNGKTEKLKYHYIKDEGVWTPSLAGIDAEEINGERCLTLNIGKDKYKVVLEKV